MGRHSRIFPASHVRQSCMYARNKTPLSMYLDMVVSRTELCRVVFHTQMLLPLSQFSSRFTRLLSAIFFFGNTMVYWVPCKSECHWVQFFNILMIAGMIFRNCSYMGHLEAWILFETSPIFIAKMPPPSTRHNGELKVQGINIDPLI
jgi:hypothetical protein